MSDLDRIRAAFDAYAAARTAFLAELGLPASNRDPLAEFSERLVAAVLGGALAENRVQARYDVTLPDGRLVQVKYLANPPGRFWVNGHTIVPPPGVHLYAVVFFEALLPVALLTFAADRLADLYDALHKRHPGRGQQLQLTQGNYTAILADPVDFTERGAALAVPPDWRLTA